MKTNLVIALVFSLIASMITTASVGAISGVFYIRDDATGGSCTSIGSWNSDTKECTLTTDVTNSTIQVLSDNIILNGGGHTVTGSVFECGIEFEQRTGVTIRNFTVRQVYHYGICVRYSNGNTITHNTLSNNGYAGAYILYSNNNTISDNIAPNNTWGIDLSHSNNNLINNNTTSGNGYTGIHVSNSSNNVISNNNVSSNNVGIEVRDTSDNNILEKNVFTDNTIYALNLSFSTGNTLTDSTFSNTSRNNTWGALFYFANSSTITRNTFNGGYYGLGVDRSNNTQIYNNSFIDNTVHLAVWDGTGNVFNLAAPIGGNYWSKYDTPAEGCNNLNGDNFCDAPYQGRDNLPWTRDGGWLNQPPIADAGGPYTIEWGEVITLDGSGSTDPDNNISLYEWDLDNDGSYDLTGPTQTITAAQIDALGVGPHPIRLQVTDTFGATGTTETTLTVNKQTTITTITSSQNPSNVGQSVTFTAQVAPALTSGTVAFKDNGMDIAGCETQTLTGGEAICETSALTPGSHAITAEYGGDANYNPSMGMLSPDQQVNCYSAIAVTNANDSGAGSLRQAIAEVCAEGTISFNDDYTITLASQLTIPKNLTIDGEGHNIVVSGNHATRVFWVDSGVTLNLQYLSVANGHGDEAGGILNNYRSTLTIANSTFSGNSASRGGGIDNFGSLTITNSTFSGNSAGEGGGIFNSSDSTLTITNSTFSGNSANWRGGGLNNRGSLTITNSAFSSNSSPWGGGILNFGTLNYVNTIIANSTSGGDCSGGGTVGTNANNLVEDGSCLAFSSGDPILGVLADNGGPTQTMALLAGSPAIDAGNDAICAAEPINNLDQRGILRPIDGDGNGSAICDIGAYEYERPINQPPVADAGGPYTVEWGATITLDGSGSTDPDNNIASYEWDLDSDGEYDDATGVTITTSFVEIGKHVIGLHVTDDDGLSDTDTATVTVTDATPPLITPSISGTEGNNGWYISDVTVAWTVDDPESSIASSDGCDTTSLTADTAGVALTCSATNGAGLSNSASVTVNIDKTAPLITWDGSIYDGYSFYFGSVPSAPTCTASDSLSGLDGSCNVSGYASTVGSYTLTAIARDNAGNQATESRNYTVLAWTLQGFYQPVDMNDVFNVVKGGSTVPFKFEIFAGSIELTDTAYIQSFTYTQTSCDTNAITDVIEMTVTGGTSLRYDAVSGQFIYNWKTPNTPGKCYRVTMTTMDSSTLVTYFKLK